MKKIRLLIRLICLIVVIPCFGIALFSSCEKDDVFTTDLALNNDTINIPNTELVSQVIVFSDTNWEVKLESPDETIWLSLSEGERQVSYKGHGRAYFKFVATGNDSGGIRYGTFAVSTAQSQKTLVIRQTN